MEDTIRIGGGIVYLLFVCCSLTINILLLIVLIRGNKEFKKASFFILTWQLLIFDFMALTTHIFLAVPTTLAGYQFYSDFFNCFFSMFDKTAYYGTLLFAVILTINRFMVFVFPKTNERFFGHPVIYYTVVFGWLLLAAFIVPLTFGGSYNFFDPVLFRLINAKIENRPWFALYITEPIADNVSIFTPWIMVVIYVITFLEIRFGFCKRLRYGADPILTVTTSTSSTNKKRGEINILLQCFIISFVFLIEWFGFNYLPKLPKVLPFLAPYVNTMTSIMTVCMNTVHSIVIFTFTSRARTILKSLFTKKQELSLQVKVIFIAQKKNSLSAIIPQRRSV